MDGYVDTRGHHIGTRKFPRYVISRREKGATELLRISLRAGDEKALPVLSSEVLARDFLRCGDLGPEWRVRESHSGELVSLLLGPYTEVMWISPNLLPNSSRRQTRCSTSWLEDTTGPVERLPRVMSYHVSGDRRSRRGSEAGSRRRVSGVRKREGVVHARSSLYHLF